MNRCTFQLLLIGMFAWATLCPRVQPDDAGEAKLEIGAANHHGCSFGLADRQNRWSSSRQRHPSDSPTDAGFLVTLATWEFPVATRRTAQSTLALPSVECLSAGDFFFLLRLQI
ncbi:MAG: hypothetical protein SFU86_10195 [Pirellulaceae bacterium]|nr:hypothetical protein [Pirellulaceae bacterium]